MQRSTTREGDERAVRRETERYASPYRPREGREVSPRPDGKAALRRGMFDITLAGVSVVLVVLGLFFVLSSSSYTSGIRGDSLSEFRSQLTWAFVGLGGMAVMTIVDYRALRNARFILFVLTGTAILLLMLKILPTSTGFLRAPVLNGSQRWIHIVVGSTTLSIQPSEIAKFAIILFLSAQLSNKYKDVRSFTRTILPCLLIAGGFFGLIMLQPNMSTAGTIMIVTLIMLFVAGCSIKQLIALAVALIPLAVVLVLTSDYRSDRLSFSDPWSMAGKESYQLVQSFYALANGGLTGTGFGMSRQKYSFLPYASSDFIFSIVAEEVGFIGAVVILLLFLALIYLGLRIAMRCPDRFGSLLATGITALIAVQVVINIAVVTGLMPTTGVPLPFFTAGGTSLAIFMTEIGMLLSISRLKTARENPAPEAFG